MEWSSHNSNAPAKDYYISDNLGTSNYNDARNMCKTGARLPTLAELKIAYDNEKLNEGKFWANEMSYSHMGYVMNSEGNREILYIGYTAKIICVIDD